MFTGLVECTGKVLAITPVQTGARFTVEVPFAQELSLGDSVAVNGCCLTVDKVAAPQVEFDLLTQTLRVTSLGALQVGSLCNLERAMGGAGRFGGHMVMGHIDATAEVLTVEPVGQDHRITIRIPEHLAKYIIDKGASPWTACRSPLPPSTTAASRNSGLPRTPGSAPPCTRTAPANAST